MENRINRRSLFRFAGLLPLAGVTAVITPQQLPDDLRETIDTSGGHINDHEQLARRVNALVRLSR